MKVIPFHREHLNIMDVRDYERVNLLPFLSDAFLHLAETLPHCYTLMFEGKLISCIGVFPLWDGVYEAWQIPSDKVHLYVHKYCRTVKGLLDTAAERLNVWRIQTASPADDLHDRWMRFIGFTCEGTLKEYSRMRKDYRMWARRYSYGS